MRLTLWTILACYIKTGVLNQSYEYQGVLTR